MQVRTMILAIVDVLGVHASVTYILLSLPMGTKFKVSCLSRHSTCASVYLHLCFSHESNMLYIFCNAWGNLTNF